jgi:putative protease
VAGGADAVYLGLRHFNARGRAENFRKTDLPRDVAYLHHHGLKCYVVLNTLVHDDEYPKALDLAWHAWQAGVDAAIIQDLGLWTTLAREVPGLKRHGSTQMTIHDPSQLEVLADLGAERVVLARELSLAEVRRCTAAAAARGVEIEHFVHGALCYAFSGQCLMSNFAGCRSANRGTCAQNCRFDYQRDGAVDTEISLKDLALATRIGDLAEAGVASLKIEGRLKGPEYVYTTSRIYRAAVDAWAAGTPFDAAWAADLQRDVFSRANSTAALDGVFAAAARLHRYAPERDGVADAQIERADRARGEVVVRSAGTVRAGQGFACTVGDFNDGFLVTQADALGGGRWMLRVRIAPRGPRLPAGTALFRNADHARKQEAATAMATVPVSAVAAPAMAVDLVVEVATGAAVRVTATATDGRRVELVGDTPLAAATGRVCDATQVRAKLGAFGGTGYACGALDLRVSASPFVPDAQLKELRRRLVAELDAAALPPPVFAAPIQGAPRLRRTALWVAVGSSAAGRAALAAGAAAVWLDDAAADWWNVAPPTLDLAGLEGHCWLRHPATAPVSPHLATLGLPVVAGHLGVMAAARAAGLAVIADHPLNTYGVATLAALGSLGASAAVLSLELSGREIARLAERCADPALPGIAVAVAGRLPSMLTRQDHGLAIGAVGTIQAVPRDGGLPYELQRRRHDTVVWEGRRLCAPVPTAMTRGLVDAWLLEFADLAPDAITELVTAYARLRDGGDATPVESIVAAHASHGLFSGHLHHGSRELDAVSSELTEA